MCIAMDRLNRCAATWRTFYDALTLFEGRHHARILGGRKGASGAREHRTCFDPRAPFGNAFIRKMAKLSMRLREPLARREGLESIVRSFELPEADDESTLQVRSGIEAHAGSGDEGPACIEEYGDLDFTS